MAGPGAALCGYVGWIVESVTVEPRSEQARMREQARLRIDDFKVVSDRYVFPDAPPLLLQISIF